MQVRTMVMERDDPATPGLLIRRYARIRSTFDPDLGAWIWVPLTASGEPATPRRGPFAASGAAFEDALAQLGGRWEDDEP